MNKLLFLALCVVTRLASAQPAAPLSTARTWSPWIQPVGAMALPSLQSLSNGYVPRLFMLPLGLNVPVSRTHELVFEATPFAREDYCVSDYAPCGSRALAVALGLAWTFRPDSSRGGVFLQPKVIGVLERSWSARRTGPTEDPWSATGRQLSVGLDVGYRVALGPVFLAFVVGASTGRGWGIPADHDSLFFSLLHAPQERRETKWVWDLNLHLLRLGANFR